MKTAKRKATKKSIKPTNKKLPKLTLELAISQFNVRDVSTAPQVLRTIADSVEEGNKIHAETQAAADKAFKTVGEERTRADKAEAELVNVTQERDAAIADLKVTKAALAKLQSWAKNAPK